MLGHIPKLQSLTVGKSQRQECEEAGQVTRIVRKLSPLRIQDQQGNSTTHTGCFIHP